MSALASGAWSQRVLAAELSKEESGSAAEVHKRLMQAQVDWSDLRTELKEKYGRELVDRMPDRQRLVYTGRYGKEVHIVSEFFDFEFSTDFRFILPRTQP